MGGLPPPVAEVCATFLEAVPPGLVTGLHLHGGLVFGEWAPGHSDVDYVAVLAHRPDDAEVAALAAAHAVVRRRHPEPPWPGFDGMHVVADDLRRDPDLLPPVPTTQLGGFTAAGRQMTLVAWHELALGGVTVHGPALADVWTDHDRLLDATRTNLDTYWRGVAAQLVAASPEDIDEASLVWCALGVTRLHHLLETGAMTAKSAAGRWALSTYDERWHRVLREALRIRDGGRAEYPADPTARGRDVTDLTAHVVALGTSS